LIYRYHLKIEVRDENTFQSVVQTMIVVDEDEIEPINEYSIDKKYRNRKNLPLSSYLLEKEVRVRDRIDLFRVRVLPPS